jgi:hypothetical protein
MALCWLHKVPTWHLNQVHDIAYQYAQVSARWVDTPEGQTYTRVEC